MRSLIITVEVVQRITSASHDPVKFIKVEHSVTVSVSLFEHFLQFLIRDFFSDFTCNPL